MPDRHMARARSPDDPIGIVSFHPQRRGTVTLEPIHPSLWRYRGGKDSDWRHVTTVYMTTGGCRPQVVPGQKLPKGYLWGETDKQVFGMGGGQQIFGPLELTCRDCGAAFVLPARVQQHLYEVARAYIDTMARRCQPCARKVNKLEAARKAYAAVLAKADGALTWQPHLAVARATIELLKAGGKVNLDRAIGIVRKARKLGAGELADRLEAQLIARRVK